MLQLEVHSLRFLYSTWDKESEKAATADAWERFGSASAPVMDTVDSWTTS